MFSKKTKLIKTGIFLLLLIYSFSLSAQRIRIVCIGDSYTSGAGIVNQEKNAYPVQLQSMLGNGYEVMNFGQEYADAIERKPNIVLINGGATDERSYAELVDLFSKLPTKPRIILLLPFSSFLSDSNQVSNVILLKNIIPMQQNVAFIKKLEVVNLFPLFVDNPSLIPDQIHPSSIGAAVIASRLYEVITQSGDKDFNIFPKIKEEKEITNFYGFECASFTFNGRKCKVVKPKVVAKGHPWIWRARFWGHEPQTDIALLERGFHVVYCDVIELYGNGEAVRLWDKFYTLIQQAGLHKKVALMGMSRGGIYVYNWALSNPEKVACIYADAPVLDLKSWPGGKGRSAGSKPDWEIVKISYQLTDEQANSFNKNPLDNAAKIAKLGFPMLHVVGDVDDLVPIAENTTPFEKIIRENGGIITVIHKPAVSHHPHSLANPTPITDFILSATGQKVNFATISAPGYEYRSGAGWIKGKDWWAQHDNIDSLLEVEKKLDVLFLGNSITQGIGGHRTSVTYKPGLKYFDSVFVNLKWECAGISGDKTQNVLWRLQNGNYAKAKPKVMVVMIGVNNISAGDSPTEVVAGIKKITNWTSKNMPSTKVLLLGPLPVGLKKDEERRKKYEEVHRLLAMQSPGKFNYELIAAPFMKPNGDLDASRYGSDGIHLLPEGYKAWAIALEPIVKKMLNGN